MFRMWTRNGAPMGAKGDMIKKFLCWALGHDTIKIVFTGEPFVVGSGSTDRKRDIWLCI